MNADKKGNADKKSGERHERLFEEDARLADDTVFETSAFERFDLWMDGSLKLLVSRHQAMAAPRASQPISLSRFTLGSRRS